MRQLPFFFYPDTSKGAPTLLGENSLQCKRFVRVGNYAGDTLVRPVTSRALFRSETKDLSESVKYGGDKLRGDGSVLKYVTEPSNAGGAVVRRLSQIFPVFPAIVRPQPSLRRRHQILFKQARILFGDFAGRS